MYRTCKLSLSIDFITVENNIFSNIPELSTERCFTKKLMLFLIICFFPGQMTPLVLTYVCTFRHQASAYTEKSKSVQCKDNCITE